VSKHFMEGGIKGNKGLYEAGRWKCVIKDTISVA
jgi:hypothetical protein